MDSATKPTPLNDHTNRSFRIFDLPTELRLEIWAFAMITDGFGCAASVFEWLPDDCYELRGMLEDPLAQEGVDGRGVDLMPWKGDTLWLDERGR